MNNKLLKYNLEKLSKHDSAVLVSGIIVDLKKEISYFTKTCYKKWDFVGSLVIHLTKMTIST